jgi:fatty-acyl-CoA synthase
MQLINDTLGGLLEMWATEIPDHEFIVYPDRNLRFTYAQFNDRVDKLSKGLINIGVKPGDKVGIWATNVPDWSTFMFATAKIGAVLVTVNTATNFLSLNILSKTRIFIHYALLMATGIAIMLIWFSSLFLN